MNFCKCSELKQPLAKPGGYLLPGIATIPVQEWEEPFSPEESLKQGSIFPVLAMPFFAGGEIHG